MLPKNLTQFFSVVLLGLLLMFGPGRAAAAPAAQTDQNIIETLADDGRFTTLLTTLAAAGLSSQLENNGPYTLFAPTDAAFEKFPDTMLNALVGNPALLINILNYHVVPQQLATADIQTLDTVRTLTNRNLALASNEGTLNINNATAVETDLSAANGVIHAIDTVLLPPGVDGVLVSETTLGLFGDLTAVPRDQQNLADFVFEGNRLTRLALLIRAANLSDTLAETGSFTLFAPTDAAFQELPAGTIESLLTNKTALRRLLLYHVAPQAITTANLATLDSTSTVLGNPLTFSTAGDTTQVNNANISATDLNVVNGVVHLIDRVLLPPAGELAQDAVLVEGALVSCSEAYQVQADDWLSKIADKFYGDPLAFSAIFDATNAAAEANPRYAVITNPNVIEVGQTLCIPPADAAETLLAAGETTAAPVVGDIISSNSRFETLANALETAGMLDTLHGEGPFTLFAPTNAAFDDLPDEQFEALLADPQNLKTVLAFHVVPADITGNALQEFNTLDTTLDQPLDLTFEGDEPDEVRVNGAGIVAVDIEAANGVVHAIDQVLLPPAEQ